MRFLIRRRLGPAVLGIVAAATVVAAAVPASASASTQASPVAGHVYVNDNTAGTNTIGAFDRHADGTLTPQAGSPFAAGGAGTGAGLASQGADPAIGTCASLATSKATSGQQRTPD
jgi:6-phosphogluconolactonase